MKMNVNGNARRGRVTLAVALALALAGAPATLAAGSGHKTRPIDQAPGEDLVGTLPALHEEQENLFDTPGVSTREDALRPAFQMIGTAEQIDSVVVGAWGDGFVTIRRLDDAGQRLVSVYGEVEILLDRAAVEQSAAATRIWLGPQFDHGAITLSYNDVPTQVMGLPGLDSFDLPLGMLAGAGVFDAGGTFAVDLAGTEGGRASLLVQDAGDLLQIVQSFD